MKKKYIIPVLIPILLFAVWAYASKVNSPQIPKVSALEDEDILSEIMLNVLNNIHYTNNVVNDDISSKTFDNYIEVLDYNKQYFLQKDIDKLEKYRFLLDDELKSKDLEFYFKAVEILYKRLNEVEGFYGEILDEPFDFTKNTPLLRVPAEKGQNRRTPGERWKLMTAFDTALYDTLSDPKQMNPIEDRIIKEQLVAAII
ncbi:MAG: hypothetical protein ACPGLV_00850, partial [Bacteroidia bacterium]